MNAAPSRYGGVADIAFQDVTDLARFGDGSADQRLVLFPSLTSPPPPPLLNQAMLDRPEDAEILDLHAMVRPPHDVAAYAIADATLVGVGLVAKGSEFFYRDDCFPHLLEAGLKSRPHSIAPHLSGAIDHPDAEILHSAEPIATVLHPLFWNWGHFLLEMLPRLFMLGVLHSLGRRFRLAVPIGMPPWIQELCARYIPRDRWLRYADEHQLVHAPSIVVPAMMNLHYDFHPAVNLLVADALPRFGIDIAAPTDGPRRIYLSRSRVGHRATDTQRMDALLDWFDFTTIHPETLSAAEQIRLYQSADIVVGEYGSALHGLIFARPGTRIVAINCMNHAQSRIARLRGHHLALVRPADGWRSDRLPAEQRGFDVDTALLHDTLAAALADLRQRPIAA